MVRGHDMIHGFGGQAMLVELSTGKTHAIDQGEESLDLLGSESVFQNVSTIESSTSTTLGLEIGIFSFTVVIISIYRLIHARKE